MRKFEDVELAWMAGLITGDGWVTLQKRGLSRGKYYKEIRAFIGVSSTDKDVVTVFGEITGIESIIEITWKKYDVLSKRKTQWRWQISNQKEVEDLLEQLLPFFITERIRKRAEIVFEFCKSHTLGTSATEYEFQLLKEVQRLSGKGVDKNTR